MDDEEFFQWYGPWAPPTISEVADLLGTLDAPWWIVGGQAIELFTGVVRHHADIDVAVLRPHATRLLEVLRSVYHCWANASGTLTPMLDDLVDLPASAQQVWVRRGAMSPWEIDFVIAEERDGRWVWRHDPSLTMTLDEMTWIRGDGLRVARAEVVLAHKAKWHQPKDDLDLASAWPLLDPPARSWLRHIVTAHYPDHPWVAKMS